MANINLKQRTFNFAVSIAKLVEVLPNTLINRAYFGQIIRSSSSVGANYRASQRAKSTKDFINKLKIVEEEADESVYFLELLMAVNPNYKVAIQGLVNEGTEILKIVVASINTARRNSQDLNT